MPHLRPEIPADAAAVRAVHLAAFPSPAEADLVDRLRGDPDWMVSVVAEDEGQPIQIGGLRGSGIVGHILITRVRVDGAPDGAEYGAIAPVGVLPTHHKRGIGSALNTRAIEEARAMGLGGLFVLGDPAYYGRFGFERADRFGLRCAWDGTEDAFRVIALDATSLTIRDAGAPGPLAMVRFHEAFSAFE